MGYKDKEKQREYQNNWMKKRRLGWIKDNGPCIKCRSWEWLEVDHIDPAQKATHRVWGWGKSRRELELRKCQILCRECHKKKTRDSVIKPHGLKGYRRGCRCDICRTEKRDHMRCYRRRKKEGLLGATPKTEHLLE